MQHALPSPLPVVDHPDHPAPHDAVGRYDDRNDLPTDIGPGQASFLLACLALAITMAMGVLALSHLADHVSLLAHNADRAAALPVAAQAGSTLATPVAWETRR